MHTIIRCHGNHICAAVLLSGALVCLTLLGSAHTQPQASSANLPRSAVQVIYHQEVSGVGNEVWTAEEGWTGDEV